MFMILSSIILCPNHAFGGLSAVCGSVWYVWNLGVQAGGGCSNGLGCTVHVFGFPFSCSSPNQNGLTQS